MQSEEWARIHHSRALYTVTQSSTHHWTPHTFTHRMHPSASLKLHQLAAADAAAPLDTVSVCTIDYGNWERDVIFAHSSILRILVVLITQFPQNAHSMHKSTHINTTKCDEGKKLRGNQLQNYKQLKIVSNGSRTAVPIHVHTKIGRVDLFF